MMISFRKKVQNLAEATTSSEVKNICSKILNENMGVPEFQFKRRVFETLKEVVDKDSHTVEFYTRLEKDLSVDKLGIKESLDEVKKFVTNDPNFLYRFKAYEYHINNLVPEYTLVEGFLGSIQPYSFDENIKGVFESISKKYQDNIVNISLKNLLWEMESSNNKFLFQPLIAKIQEYVENPNQSLKSDIMFEMNRAGLPQFGRCLDALKKEAVSVNENAVEIFHSNKDFTISNIISPVFIDGDSKFFATKRNLYKIQESTLTKIEKKDANPAWLSLLESFNFFNVDTNRISRTIDKGKISFDLNENKFFLNETETSLEKLSQMGYFQYSNAEIATNLMKVSENRDLIVDIDFAKEISSNIVESQIELFKIGPKIYANKSNPKMGINELAEYTALGIVKEAKDFLGIDISETFKNEVTTDSTKLIKIEEEQKEITDSIKSLKDTIIKLDEAMEKNPSLKEGLIDLQATINEEIENHQNDWNKLEEDKRSLIKVVVNENGTETPPAEEDKCTCKDGECESCKKVNEEENKFSIGDKVKTKSGVTGEVTAINSNDCTVDILKDDGKTTTFSYDQLQSREKEVKKEEKDQEGTEDKPVIKDKE